MEFYQHVHNYKTWMLQVAKEQALPLSTHMLITSSGPDMADIDAYISLNTLFGVRCTIISNVKQYMTHVRYHDI